MTYTKPYETDERSATARVAGPRAGSTTQAGELAAVPAFSPSQVVPVTGA
jgi:hypothetical protein